MIWKAFNRSLASGLVLTVGLFGMEVTLALELPDNYAESVMIGSLSADGSEDLSLRLARFPNDGRAHVWLHFAQGADAFSVVDESFETSGRATDVTRAAVRFEAARENHHVSFTSEQRTEPIKTGRVTGEFAVNQTRHPGKERGRLPIALDIHFESGGPGFRSASGRWELTGRVSGWVEIDGRRIAIDHEGGKWHEQTGPRAEFAPAFTYLNLQGSDAALLAIGFARRAVGYAMIGGEVVELASFSIDPAGSDERAFAVELKNGLEISGKTRVVQDWSVEIEGKRRPGSSVIASSNVGRMLGSLNDWDPAAAQFAVERLSNNPLVVVSDTPDLRENINGPSMIRVPDWVEAPLGRYYLYFAHHQGKYIRLAYADEPTGPFTVYPGGVLPLAESGFPVDPPTADELPAERQQTVEAGKPIDFYTHIASPDVHVVAERNEIRMYYHGLEKDGRQYTRVAVSSDGINFRAREELLGRPYFRVFRHRDAWFALAMPGVFYRSEDGLANFERGPSLFSPMMRHSAVMTAGETLHVFYTNAGDAPESVLHAAIDLSGDWMDWKEGASTLVLAPQTRWEGGHLPVSPSARGAIKTVVNQIRDPAIFQQGDETYLYYSIGGESGIAVARLLRR